MDVKALEIASMAIQSDSERALYYIRTEASCCEIWSDGSCTISDDSLSRRKLVPAVSKTVMEMANGRVNFNLPFVPERIRTEARQLESRGVIARCRFSDVPAPIGLRDTHYIKNVKWAITGRCNYRCKHCFLSAPEARFGELPLEDCKRVIREMEEIGVSSVSLSGGEPLVRPDFMEIVDELVKKGINIQSISTNGALVSDRLLDNLEQRGQKPNFAMSFDGVGWHDWLRGIDGAEKMLMGKFELLTKRGFLTISAMTLHKRNAGVLRETINCLADKGVNLVIINRMTNFGQWKKYGQDFNITQKQVLDLYLKYLPDFYADGMPTNVVLNRVIDLKKNSFDYKISAIHSHRCSEKTKICPAAFQEMFITADGKLAPCLPISGMDGQQANFADLTQMHLRDALERSAYSACVGSTIKDYFAKNKECADCPYKWYCRGGCRAQALEFDENDFMGVDRHRCEFFFGHYTEKILKRLAETVPDARCVNLPEDYPLDPEIWQPVGF